VVDTALAPLPKGRHSLSREQVAQAQRVRLAVAMADAMAERGYVGTPVAAVLERAGVSRETFYQLYDDKLACFLDALEFVGEVLVAELATALGGPGDPLDRAVHAVDRYLDTIVEHPAFARLFLVEVHAAGPEAIARRAALQARLVGGLVDTFGARTQQARFACRAFVAAVASLVTLPVATGDRDAVRALRRPLREHLRVLAEAGALGPRRPSGR
jgi:AcrR family transcriptional regulator